MTSLIVGKRSILAVVGLVFLLWLVMGFSFHQIFQNQMIGIDYMFYWHAGRVLLVDHSNIYSPEVGVQNQLWIYGRLALPGEDHLNFAYPPYILFLPSPLFLLSYDWSQAFWMATNLLLLMCIGLFFFPAAPKWIPLTFLIFYPIYFTLIIGNTALPIGLLLIVTLNLLLFKKEISHRTDFILGILLAFTTGKPQMVWLFLLLILFICIDRKRWSLIYGFIITFVLMNVVSFVLFPTWPINWLQNTLMYSKEGGIQPTLIWYLSAFIPQSLTLVIYAILFLVSLPITGFLFRNWGRGRFDTLSLIAYVAFITNLFDPSSFTPDKIVLLIPLFLWAVHCYSGSKSVKVIWVLGILLTNVAFLIGQTTEFKLAVDILPLLFYTPWMVYIILSQHKTHRSLTLQFTELS